MIKIAKVDFNFDKIIRYREKLKKQFKCRLCIGRLKIKIFMTVYE